MGNVLTNLPKAGEPVRYVDVIDDSGTMRLAVDAQIDGSDIQIGAVEIKDGVTNDRATVNPDGSLDVNIVSGDITIGAVEIKDESTNIRANVVLDVIQNALFVQSESLASESTLSSVDTSLNNIETNFDVALSTRASQVTVASVLSNQTNKTQFTRLTDATNDVTVNTQGIAGVGLDVLNRAVFLTVPPSLTNGQTHALTVTSDGKLRTDTVITSLTLSPVDDGVYIGHTDGTVLTTTLGLKVIAQANSGVDIGDVTINNAAGASAVNIQDGGNSITIDAVSLPLPTGASTSANQTTVGSQTTKINDGVDTALITTAGRLQTENDPARVSAGTQVAVSVTTVATSIIASNAARKKFIVYNNGVRNLFVGFSAGVTIVNGFPMSPGSSYEEELYTGAVFGIVSAGSVDTRYIEL